MLRVDCARWGQTPESLRHLALSAPHARTRERALALFDITQHSCATQVAGRTGRRAHTGMDWVHAYNAQGPDALAFRRTGGRRPFFARSAKPTAARSSAPPSAQPRRRPEPGLIQRRAGHCAAWSAGCAPGSGSWSAARRSARPCTASSCRGRKPRSVSAEPTRSGGRRWRQALIEPLQGVLAGAQRDQHLLVYVDEAHIHQDADLGYGWGERGQRFFVASSSPGLSAKVSFYGLYLYNEGQVRLWPYPRANGEHTVEVLQRLRTEAADRTLIVLWDGAPYHRAKAVREVATTLGIKLIPLPGYSPDLMPVEALW